MESSERKIFKGSYELRMFCNLPDSLKDKIIGMNGEEVSLSEINPFSLVCIQISDNPGVRPYIIQEGQTSYDLFKMFAKQRGFSISEFNKALSSKCSI